MTYLHVQNFHHWPRAEGFESTTSLIGGSNGPWVQEHPIPSRPAYDLIDPAEFPGGQLGSGRGSGGGHQGPSRQRGGGSGEGRPWEEREERGVST